jgi:hypothetical protein
MSKTKRFDIEANEPSGTTFTAKPGSFAGDKQSKRSARFGIECGPSGTTFQAPNEIVKFPDASDKPKATKVVSASSGQGKYSPPRVGARDFGGSVGVGKSARK